MDGADPKLIATLTKAESLSREILKFILDKVEDGNRHDEGIESAMVVVSALAMACGTATALGIQNPDADRIDEGLGFVDQLIRSAARAALRKHGRSES